MEEVKVYMIANLQIHDADRYREYEKGFFPLLKKYSGEFITYDDNIVNVEGEKPMEGRVILFSFPLQNMQKTGIQILNTKNYQSIDGQVLQQL